MIRSLLRDLRPCNLGSVRLICSSVGPHAAQGQSSGHITPLFQPSPAWGCQYPSIDSPPFFNPSVFIFSLSLSTPCLLMRSCLPPRFAIKRRPSHSLHLHLPVLSAPLLSLETLHPSIPSSKALAAKASIMKSQQALLC